MPDEHFTPAQVADRLHLRANMVRRYAQALEAAIGERLERGPKGERLFTGDHMNVLERARLLVRDNPGISVESAVGMVLGQREPPAALAVPAPSLEVQAVLQAVQELRDELRAARATQALPSGDEDLRAIVSQQTEELRVMRLALEQLQALERQRVEALERQAQAAPAEPARPWFARLFRRR